MQSLAVQAVVAMMKSLQQQKMLTYSEIPAKQFRPMFIANITITCNFAQE